jgi:hypothetical protein
MKRLLFQTSMATRLSWAVGLVGSGLASPALGQIQSSGEIDDFGGYYEGNTGRPRIESRRDFSFEMRFGPYLPRVDSEFDGGQTPFKDFFGKSNRFMLGAEFDWLPLEVPNVLRFGAGVGVSYTTMSANAHASATDLPTAQSTGLRILPHWAVGVFKFDLLHRQTPIPVVFTAKLGFANALWWVNDAPSPNRAADGTRGRGQSFGYYYGLGAAVDLGILDPYRAKRMDHFVGINSIYLFGEFYGMELNSLGASDTMQVGDRTWVLGLSFDI